MKITKRQLRRIIKEETAKALNEADPRLRPHHLHKGSSIRAKQKARLPAYTSSGMRDVQKGSTWVVDAIGSGTGPEDVIAYGRGYAQIVISPPDLSDFFELVKK
jgi:hypothetical protein|tara:strand:- start:1096 stop:1407 length:312 start_codon:yes stop_codon:yes gene_type:complete